MIMFVFLILKDLKYKQKKENIMQKPKKKGVIFFSIITYACFAAYIVLFLLAGVFRPVAGDEFLANGLRGFTSAHVNRIPLIIDFALPHGKLWSFIVLGYLVVIAVAIILAVLIGGRKGRFITANGMIAVIISIVPVTLTGCGFDCYQRVFSRVAPYTSRLLLAFIICLVAAAALFVIFALILLFLCIRNACKYPAQEEQKEPVEEDVMEVLDSMTREELMALIKQAVREVMAEDAENVEPRVAQYFGINNPEGAEVKVVKDENGKPVIAQYFNGGNEEVAPEPAPEPEPEPEEEPVEEPAVEEVPEEAEEGGKERAERIPFARRILGLDKDMKDAYCEIKNEILAYGVKSRMSNSGDTFRLHRKTYMKIVVAGKGLKLYFALEPSDYADSPIPVQDVGDKNLYVDIPLAFKVKSDLSRRRAKQLIADAMAKDGVEKEGEAGDTDWIREIRVELKAQQNK